MPGTPLYFLLVVVLVSTHGDTLGDTTHCNATVDHDLNQGDVTTVLTATKNSTTIVRAGYVKPKEGFEGVSVEVQGGKNSEEAWFPADETCLPASGSWWKFRVKVLLDTEQDKLTFRLYCGKCKWSCDISDIHITSMEGILVKAHGPSSWNTIPKNCMAIQRYDSKFSKVACKKLSTRSLTNRPQASTNRPQASTNRPQASTNRPQASSGLLEVAGSAVAGTLAVGLVALIVALVAVYLWHRSRP
ncbi:uncharacterized protein LOC123507092 isoform X2 [Portunus trituberculatus]|uniref:uncharacterized protein LOC123507092 isoform X2 n=1 Tax=Portunus trituberculatus TaxID=210409 RepID=UPI001E1CB83D|nr:uncharacterized protein LOC123507092 isoform X2 [Portunus trituberculatus]